MIFNEMELDKIVLSILDDCQEVNPPLDRFEISRHVVDHLSETINDHVFASLERLARNGDAVTEAGRYWVVPVPAR